MHTKLMRNVSVDLDEREQLMITHSAFVKYMRKSGNTMGQFVSYL
jgi:hypothetical protein